MARVDLDARRAEEQGHVVVLGGTEYQLAGSMPLAVAEAMSEGRFRDAMRTLVPGVPDSELDRFTVEDIKQIGTECYGLTFPESVASSRPSASNGTRSTPTSSALTG